MKKNNDGSLGSRLKQLRGEMTQQDFADLLGVGRTTLIKYESDERQPDAEFLIKLHVLYGVQPLWLLTGKGDAVVGVKLTPRESQLLHNYRQAAEQGKAALESMAQVMAKKN